MSRTKSLRAGVVFAALNCGLFAPTLFGVSVAWTGQSPVNGNFSQVYNWGTFPVAPLPPPGPGDIAFFTNPAATRSTVVFDGSYTVTGALVSGTTIPAGNYTFAGGGAGTGLTCTSVFQVDNSSGATALTFSNGFGLTANSINLGTGNGMGLQDAGTAVYTPNAFMIEGNSTLGVRSGSTLTSYLDDASSGIVLVNSATINANGFEKRSTGNLDIESGGVFNLKQTLTGFAFDGSVRSGQFRLLAGGTLNFVGARRLDITDQGTFVLGQGWALPANGDLRAAGGGDITSSSYLDVGNGVRGLLTIDGAGSTFNSASSTCDWGSNTGGDSVVTISNSGVANANAINAAVNGGKGIINLLSSGQLTVTNGFFVGGGAAVRQVEVNASGGTLTTNGSATFNNQAAVSLGTSGSGGAINFNQGATFNAGSSFLWAGGALNVPSGKTLALAGGSMNVTAGGFGLGNGVTISVTAGGTFTSSNYVDVANFSGARTGTVLVSGNGSTYTTNASFSDLGKNASNVGTMTFDSNAVGNINGGLQIASNGGTGTLNINSGATVNVASQFGAGGIAASLATVNIAGGTLNLTTNGSFNVGSTVNVSSGGNLIWGNGKTLTFNKGKANLTVAGTAQPSGTTLAISNGGIFQTTSYYDLHNGTINIDGLNSSMDVSGTSVTDWAATSGDVSNVTISNSGVAFYRGGLRIGVGGTANVTLNSSGLLRTVNKPMSLGAGAASLVTVNINGGVLSSIGAGSDVLIAQGSTVHINTGAALFDGSLTMTGNAKIICHDIGTTIDYIACGNLSMAPGTKIDLALNGFLTVDYTAGSAADQIRGLIAAGFASGSWTGNGITSSYCATHPNYRIAYIDDTNAIYIASTIAGDADGNTIVNFDDLLTLAQHYNLPGFQHWQDGDFDYNGTVNFDDLLVLAQQYGNHILSDGQSTLLGQQFQSDYSLALSMVPEPTTLSLLAGVGLLARRRRVAVG